MQQTKTTKKLFVIVAIILVAFIVYMVVRTFMNRNDGTLSLAVVPDDAVISLGIGQTIPQGTVSLKPGQYHISIARNGFGTQTLNITILSKQTITKRVALNATNNIGKQWLRDHPDQARLKGSIDSANGTSTAQQTLDTYPILKQLPYYGAGGTFDLDFSYVIGTNNTSFTIFVNYYTTEGKQAARDWITQQNYNPDATTIVYNDKTSQFQGTDNPGTH